MVVSWLVRWTCHALLTQVGLVKICSSIYTISFVPIAKQAGHAVMPRRLSLNLCVCTPYSTKLASIFFIVTPRETRKGWPMLTVETEVNGGSKRTNERGPSLVGSFVTYTRRAIAIDFCPALTALVNPVHNIIFSPYTFSLY